MTAVAKANKVNPNLVQTFSMYISKATYDGKVMKWSAVNSDTDRDSYLERMSVDLYKDFLSRIESEEGVPDVFRSAVCSQYWCGGMPYVSVSHYTDLNGEAVPGEPLELYVDGDGNKARLKAKGILFDSPLGHAVYRSLKEDKNRLPDDRIRISIGFLDLGHKHGDNGSLWERKSLTDLCPECLSGIGEKIYVKGCLVHLALTRVPVNKRTEMVLEEKSEMAKKTRKEDAASIIGDDLAKEIDQKSKTVNLRSDVLIEMSEGENGEKPEETQPDPPEAPIDDVRPETPEVEELPAPQPEQVEQVEQVERVEQVEKSDADEPVAEKMDPSVLPYSGAVSLEEAVQIEKAREEMWRVMDLWGMLSQVAWNIIDRDDITDKKAAFSRAVDEFKSMLAAKAMVEFGMTEKSAAAPVEDSHPLKPALDVLLSAVDNSLGLEGDLNSKLSFLNSPLQELGEAITGYVKDKSVVASEPPAPDNDNDNLIQRIEQIIQPLSLSVKELSDRVGTIEAKSTAASTQPRNRIPEPRSLPSSLVQKAEPAVKPGSLTHIIRKSVGLNE